MKLRYGLIKPSLDAHTLGINFVYELLNECNQYVVLAEKEIEIAIEKIDENTFSILSDWISKHELNVLAISYRLDTGDALSIITNFVNFVEQYNQESTNKIIKIVYAGLPNSCALINETFPNIITFEGGEILKDTLISLGVDESNIPQNLIIDSKYDADRFEYARKIIDNHSYLNFKPIKRMKYKEYGTRDDTLFKRVSANLNDNYLPLTRAHVGPYSSVKTREESVQDFIGWTKKLAKDGYLDIVSIGSSQLTQEAFEEDWSNRINGGGVPIQNSEEYRKIYNASRPLLIRTYAGTKNIVHLAHVHEETINIAWHALSLWWFNKLDNRGPYGLLENLQQHFDVLTYIAESNKPFEPNIPHHFGFRGSDDITYVLSVYLAAILAKKKGVKQFVLQLMLNTPKYTWGIQDLAKSRAAIDLIKGLEDDNFKIVIQPRAGLDYFSNNLEQAKIQLASISMLMDDIEPNNSLSPEIIHIVSYSEALYLATPDIINESVQIALYSIQSYREFKKDNKSLVCKYENEVNKRKGYIFDSVKYIVSALESKVSNLWTPEGFYDIYRSGCLPVPYLWSKDPEFDMSKNWKTKVYNGGVFLLDFNDKIIDIGERIKIVLKNYENIKKTSGNMGDKS